ncbi:hypothetical protein [Arthrobacter sp. VKM Ac-2550]|uniref:hypothetical protein n=1 Tax=Crystallibacter permensis TaxID=1938888 RepID=UPI0022266A3E|nr:hypothetical protein [Arthrobacter sp. VKM Ac-2550]MCW2132936.1 hypothetical protein [Arthrobacter sp. VKM Ac-2550]
MSTAMVLETDWKKDALTAIRKEATTGRHFDALDLQERYSMADPANPNQWGALFSAAAKDQLIHVIGYHRSRRPGRSGGVCAVWQGRPEHRGMLL